jgi:hypothetical protein
MSTTAATTTAITKLQIAPISHSPLVCDVRQ